jgi:hypothetical protein
LKNLQKSKNCKLLRLIRDTDTRWSSTFAMLKRFGLFFFFLIFTRLPGL